jgi:hypothetical protein
MTTSDPWAVGTAHVERALVSPREALPMKKCRSSFALANGFAAEAIVGENIAIFCSTGCSFSEIPSNHYARA